MGIYESLGVQPVINAAGPVTRLSGAPLDPEVAAAMAEAAQALRPDRGLAGGGRALSGRGDRGRGGLRRRRGGGGAEPVGGGLHRRAGCRGDGPAAGHDRAARRDRRPARAPDGLHARVAPGRGATGRGRLSSAFPGQGITWPWQVEAAITERTAAPSPGRTADRGGSCRWRRWSRSRTGTICR